MTREEEINEAVKQFNMEYFPSPQLAFRMGIDWADKHPINKDSYESK